MEFFLPFQIQTFPFQISYSDKILFIGSCFSEEIGNKLKELKFNILQNPNGILYDPLSISESLFSYIENNPFEEENLFELNGLWHSWKHHSSFSAQNKDDVLGKINTSQSGAHAFLKDADFLIITLGTAFYYRLKDNNENVANCHKASATIFEKRLLSVNDLVSDFLSLLTALEIFNPTLKIIFTVSPVKHVRDGVVENNRSKAKLIDAVHSISEQKENVFYFPSYELVTDILRDYRFYKNDLVHPNETAINFVFEKFCESLLNIESKNIMKEVKQIVSAANHKPFFKESEAHQTFITMQLKKIHKIEKAYSFLDLSKEKKYFIQQATNLC
ncbi:MAG TPA: GSCFA domain-containing protein [Hanamia sp.]